MTINASHIYSLIMTLGLHALVVLVILVQWEFKYLDTTPVLEVPHAINVQLADSNPYAEKEPGKVSKKDGRNEKKPDMTGIKKPKETALPKEQSSTKKPEQLSVPDEAGTRAERLEDIRREEQSLMAQNLADMVAAEQAARQAVTDDEKAMAYVQRIQSDIIRNWSRPPSARNGMQTLLRVFLVPTGELVDVVVEESSGNDAFDRSALLAVEKAQPFEVPPEANLFERQFRQFTVLFRPEDLRL
ncbi:MAG: cell envelope integrity protein TolA [Gammaproteobacteria bacterium]|nr:cell envelope integrity protein TolA [Gammaproteobacteria bacterium]